MSIIKCCSCQKVIHIGENFGTSCIFCGAANNYSTNSSLRGKIQEYIRKIKELIKASKFRDAMEVCNDYIEIYPNIAELYWLRLLAHYNCKNDVELIQKGVNIKNDIDFTCCMHFADSLEKECLEQLWTIREAIISDINQALITTERKEKIKTGISDIKKNTESELNQLRKDLREQVVELDSAEKELRDAFFDCSVMISSRKQRFNEFLGKAEQSKKQIDSKNEMTESEKATFEIALGKYIAATATEFGELMSEEDPCFDRYKQAKAKQGRIEKKIQEINTKISHIFDEQNDVINLVNIISAKYADAKVQMDLGNLSSVATLIGRSTLTDIIKKHIIFQQ